MNILMMRHSYDDHSYIDGKNDTSLTQHGIQLARDEFSLLGPVLEPHRDGLGLYVSSKKRAIETANILSEFLDFQNIPYDVNIDDRFRELYQGVIRDPAGRDHDEKVRLLEHAWEIFDKERIIGNDDYKFGTPDWSDEKYQYFNGFIEPPYGESQNELSQRVKIAFLGAVAIAANMHHTPLIVTHRGIIREILNITIAHNNRSYDVKQNPYIEMAGWKYCQIFSAPLEDIEFSLSALKGQIYA